MASDKLVIDYSLLRQPRLIVGLTAGLTVLYNAIAYLNRMNNQWLFDGSFTWVVFLRFLLIDQFLIEIVTIAILLFLLRYYATKLSIMLAGWKAWSIVMYLLKFIPVLAFAFFVFNPITQTLRFMLNEYPDWKLSAYWSGYFYSWQLYTTYLPAVFMAGISALSLNLLVNYKRDLVKANSDRNNNLIIALDSSGEVLIEQESILWVEKIERYNYVFTAHGRFRLKQNISQFEAMVPPGHFVRVNRSVVANTKAIKNYSYWENDKYILRLINDKEFVMPRMRLKYFRERFVSQK